MASSDLRKKWGTIFMGEREATMEQLDAMQEPVLRERQQRDQQKEYLERVRKRAADRAREILAEAYTERQNLLNETKEALELERQKLLQEIAGIRKEAETKRAQAQAELDRAKAVGAEADRIRNAAHDEGFQHGMDQAGQELREFRADMGNELAKLMRALEGQISAITAFWRDDLAELMRVAVRSATGYVLDEQHEAILSNLVFQAINLLEQREVVTLRVNPEDESIVSDLFTAAREKAPELKQWIVNGDESIERGGLIAESGSGSVDLRRQNFTELLDSILSHLFLPVREAEKEALAEIHEEVEAQALHFSAPEDEAVTRAEEDLQADAANEREVAAAPRAQQGEVLPQEGSSSPTAPLEQEGAPLQTNPSAQMQSAPQQTQTVESHNAPTSEPSHDESFTLPDDVFDLEPELESAKGPASAEAETLSTKDLEDELLSDDIPLPEEAHPAPSVQDSLAPKQQPTEAAAADPSLAELEDELFPLSQDEEHEVLQHGGFLPNTQAS